MQAAKPTVRNGYIVRTGRGYSFEELKEAGIDPRIARRRGVPVDVWRQTKHPENVEQLKSISKTIEPRKAATKKEEKTAKKEEKTAKKEEKTAKKEEKTAKKPKKE